MAAPTAERLLTAIRRDGFTGLPALVALDLSWHRHERPSTPQIQAIADTIWTRAPTPTPPPPGGRWRSGHKMQRRAVRELAGHAMAWRSSAETAALAEYVGGGRPGAPGSAEFYVHLDAAMETFTSQRAGDLYVAALTEVWAFDYLVIALLAGMAAEEASERAFAADDRSGLRTLAALRGL